MYHPGDAIITVVSSTGGVRMDKFDDHKHVRTLAVTDMSGVTFDALCTKAWRSDGM